jgi:hypothetical protein
MLSEQVLELLTAFVDGELSQRQRKAVMRLLHRSSEARDMLRQLQENAHKIKKLPRHKVEPSLVGSIMEAIADRQAQPAPATKRTRRRAWVPYVVATMAASVLIAIIGLAYWQTMGDGGADKDKFVKNVQPDPHKPTPDGPAKKKKHPYLDKMLEGVAIGVGRTPIEQLFTAEFGELRDAKGLAVSGLTEKLNDAKTAVHVDVTVKNNTIAIDRLRDVLKNRGITVVIDPAVSKTLDNKKVEYLVFAENLNPDDVTKLMSELSEEFPLGQINNQHMEPSPYKKLEVKPISNQHKDQLTKLLGKDLGSMERKDVKPVAKTAPVAVLLPSSAGATPSPEVRQFVERRQPQPGTLQILIRIHQD